MLDPSVTLLSADRRRLYFLSGDRKVATNCGEGRLLYLCLDGSGCAGVRIGDERGVYEFGVATVKAVSL